MRSALFFLTGSTVGAVVLVPLFLLIHGVPSVSASWWLVLAAFVVGIPVHELIHGVTCAYVSDNNYKSISYGVSLTRFCAYCRYTRPVDVPMRYWVSLMPFFVLAVAPAVVALVGGWAPVLL
ncbi:MAG: DUF3267 domain-containing protein, partial [Paludibacteraceae bacterium]|nr:DUF3267 domain-containing protein [Paludibacteraceae bacterium]